MFRSKTLLVAAIMVSLSASPAVGVTDDSKAASAGKQQVIKILPRAEVKARVWGGWFRANNLASNSACSYELAVDGERRPQIVTPPVEGGKHSDWIMFTAPAHRTVTIRACDADIYVYKHSSLVGGVWTAIRHDMPAGKVRVAISNRSWVSFYGYSLRFIGGRPNAKKTHEMPVPAGTVVGYTWPAGPEDVVRIKQHVKGPNKTWITMQLPSFEEG